MLLINGTTPEEVKLIKNGVESPVFTLNVKYGDNKKRAWIKTIYLNEKFSLGIQNGAYNLRAFQYPFKMWNNVTNNIHFERVSPEGQPFLGYNNAYDYFVGGVKADAYGDYSVYGHPVAVYNHASMFADVSYPSGISFNAEAWGTDAWHDNNHSSCFVNFWYNLGWSTLSFYDANLGNCDTMFRDAYIRGELKFVNCKIENPRYMFDNDEGGGFRCSQFSGFTSDCEVVGDATGMFYGFNADAMYNMPDGEVPNLSFVPQILFNSRRTGITSLNSLFYDSDLTVYRDYHMERGFDTYVGKDCNTAYMYRGANINMGQHVTCGGNFSSPIYSHEGMFSYANLYLYRLGGTIGGNCANMFRGTYFRGSTFWDMGFHIYDGAVASNMFRDCKDLIMGWFKCDTEDAILSNFMFNAGFSSTTGIEIYDGVLNAKATDYAFATPMLASLSNDLPRGAEGQQYEGSIIRSNDFYCMFENASYYRPCFENQGNYIRNSVWIGANSIGHTGMLKRCTSFFKYVDYLYLNFIDWQADTTVKTNPVNAFARFVELYMGATIQTKSAQYVNFRLEKRSPSLSDTSITYVQFNAKVSFYSTNTLQMYLTSNNTTFRANNLFTFVTDWNKRYANGVDAMDGYDYIYAELVTQNTTFI